MIIEIIRKGRNEVNETFNLNNVRSIKVEDGMFKIFANGFTNEYNIDYYNIVVRDEKTGEEFCHL